MSLDRSAAFAIVEYLLSYIETHRDSDVEALQVAVDCITASFNLSDSRDVSMSLKPFSLPSVIEAGKSALRSRRRVVTEPPPGFNEFIEEMKGDGFFGDLQEGTEEYGKKMDEAKAVFYVRRGANRPQNVPPVRHQSAEEKKKKATELKERGNIHMNNKKFKEAIDCYTQASMLDENNAVFYANTAAAYMHLGKYDQATKNCRQAIRVDPNYAKAYHRLGNSLFYQRKYREAIDEGYKKALELQPDNVTFKESLEGAERKVGSREGQEMGGFDLASILNNPNIMGLATQMMNTPGVGEMVGSMAENMFGGSGRGEAPNFGDMMSNMFGNAMAQHPPPSQETVDREDNSAEIPADVNEGESETDDIYGVGSVDQEERSVDGQKGGSDDNVQESQPGASMNELMSMLTPEVMAVLGDPQKFEELLEGDRVRQLKENPKFASIIDAVKLTGPMAIMGYLNDPDVVEMLKVLFEEHFGNEQK